MLSLLRSRFGTPGATPVIAALALGVLALTGFSPVPAAGAISPPAVLWKAGETGSAAGQTLMPRGVAVDEATGHLYVADQANARIGEFDAWGQFIRAWGWGVADGSSAELQTCTTACFSGLTSSGPGGFDNPQGVAVDSAGAVFVVDKDNSRVQKFDVSGAQVEFALMFGGEVNKTTGADVCTQSDVEGGDECGPGVSGSPGAGEGTFGTWVGVGSFIAIHQGPIDSIYVGDQERIQRFDTNGVFQDQLQGGMLSGERVQSLAVDPAGNLLVSFFLGPSPLILSKEDVRKLSPTGSSLCSLAVVNPRAIATDADGNVYVINRKGSALPKSGMIMFDPDCQKIDLGAEEPGVGAEEFTVPTGIATSSACDIEGVDILIANSDHDDSFVRAYGPPPDPSLCPQPKAPPSITDQYAVSVDTTEAVVRAVINPRFWSDTRYHVEYGTASCEANPCESQPLGPGALLTSKVVDSALRSPGVLLANLQPDTTYHYRFVAESGGGGPVFGADRTFRTPPLPVAPKADCPNQSFRVGDAIRLGDCRAYEMVSPVDKNGADVDVTFTIIGDRAARDQGSRSGERITYSSQKAFGQVEGAPYSSQYLATRGAGGWANESISPPRNGPSINTIAGLDSQYKAFSGELDSAWLVQDSDLSLAPGSIPGYPNLYYRDNASGTYEALTTTPPPNVAPEDLQLELQGASADGSRAFFLANDVLATGGTEGKTQLYEAHQGQLTLVCVGASGSASKKDCSAGSPEGSAGVDHGANLSHAISDDGSVVYWSDGALNGPGKLFVRIGGEETAVVSAGAAAQFWTAATDGSKALYSEEGKLYEFDLASRTRTEIAVGVQGLMGAGDDASKVYFVSTQALEEAAQAGEPNLYLYEAGVGFTYVATLAAADLTASLSPVASEPTGRTSRVTPDGDHAVFMSTGRLTGFDNTDAETGEAAAEVFLYDAATEELRCVSCLADGVRPTGRKVVIGSKHFSLNAAAQIPPFTDQLYAPRILSEDGSRLFFESFDPLAHGDTNGKQDVYEWEEAGAGSCEAGGFGYRSDLGGCITLISSGKSPEDSRFVDASADGRDVFFKTASSLLAQDPGLIDIYDARAGGGYPPPPSPPQLCEGETCQSPTVPPGAATPASSSFRGPGDPGPGRTRARRCSKAKRGAARKADRARCAKPRAKARSQRRRAR